MSDGGLLYGGDMKKLIDILGKLKDLPRPRTYNMKLLPLYELYDVMDLMILNNEAWMEINSLLGRELYLIIWTLVDIILERKKITSNIFTTIDGLGFLGMETSVGYYYSKETFEVQTSKILSSQTTECFQSYKNHSNSICLNLNRWDSILIRFLILYQIFL